MKTMISTSTDESTGDDYITWFKSEVQQGIDDVNAGRVVSHEEAIARFNKILES